MSQSGSDAPTVQPRSSDSSGVLNQDVIGGIILIAIAALALWLTSDLPRGTLSSAGPAMLPQALAVLLGTCGIALAISGVRSRANEANIWSLRGPLLITLAIALFAVTIRQSHIGSVETPELGLAFAGPLAIMVGGMASPDVRFRDLALLALTLTPFCMLLFGDALNMPIPLLPRSIALGLFEGWSYKASLRVTAGLFFCAAVMVYLLTRRHGSTTDSGKEGSS